MSNICVLYDLPNLVVVGGFVQSDMPVILTVSGGTFLFTLLRGHLKGIETLYGVSVGV